MLAKDKAVAMAKQHCRPLRQPQETDVGQRRDWAPPPPNVSRKPHKGVLTAGPGFLRNLSQLLDLRVAKVSNGW